MTARPHDPTLPDVGQGSPMPPRPPSNVHRLPLDPAAQRLVDAISDATEGRIEVALEPIRLELALVRQALHVQGGAIESLRCGVLEAIATSNTAHRTAERASQTNEVGAAAVGVLIDDKRESIRARARRREELWAAFGKAVVPVLVAAAGLAAGVMKACGG
jgi:hypothetical protein